MSDRTCRTRERSWLAPNSRDEVVLGAFTAMSALVSATSATSSATRARGRAEQVKDNAKDDVARLAGELAQDRSERSGHS